MRVDTNADVEIRRWLFPKITVGLRELGQTIQATGYLLKLCGTAAELQGALPARWHVQSPAYFMLGTRRAGEQPLLPGYSAQTSCDGSVSSVRITTPEGELAASGYAAETDMAFIYDRVITQPAHRRKGLGRTLMSVLGQAKRNLTLPELLVATGDGRALYTSLGWQTISPYSTASIPLACRSD